MIMNIDQYRFGSLRLDGVLYRRDLRIRGREIFPDWWRNQGHVCDRADLDDLLTPEITTILLGTGASGLMRPAPGLVAWCAANHIRLLALPTAEAVAEFNRLQAGDPDRVLAGFHLTC